MRIISGAEVRRIYTMRDAVIATERAFVTYSAQSAVVPLRTNITVPGTAADNTLFMPAFAEGDLGVKIVSVRPNLRPAISATYVDVDRETGQVKSIVDGTTLTYFRTGAATGVAVRHLVRKDVQNIVIAVMGCGTQGKAGTEAAVVALDLAGRGQKAAKIIALDNFDGCRQAFCTWARETFPEVEIVDGGSGYEKCSKAVAEADVVITATTAGVPLFSADAVRPGTLVSLVGAYTPTTRESESALIAKAKLFADTIHGVVEEAGDYLIPLGEKLFGEDHLLGEIGQVASGKLKGRTSDEEIIVFKTVGSAVQDVIVGSEIARIANKRDVGIVVDM